MANFNIGRWDFIRVKKKEIVGEIRDRVIKQINTKSFIKLVVREGILRKLYQNFKEKKDKYFIENLKSNKVRMLQYFFLYRWHQGIMNRATEREHETIKLLRLQGDIDKLREYERTVSLDVIYRRDVRLSLNYRSMFLHRHHIEQIGSYAHENKNVMK